VRIYQGGGHCRARERVLDVAGRLFREKGFDGIGIDDLMKGSWADARRFYANFKSKEGLMAKSCERTLAELVENWTKVTSKAKREPLRAIVAGYLSISHRDDPANGCVVAALGAGVARRAPRFVTLSLRVCDRSSIY
jgi:TetR/AcrR family transcriptional repressor of nem operon